MTPTLAQPEMAAAAPPSLDASSGAPAEVGTVMSTMMDLFHNQILIFVVSFVVALGMTPVMRQLALAAGIVDAPTEARKGHRVPVAYLGGVAVFLGIFIAIAFSYVGFVGQLPEWLYVPHDPLSAIEQVNVPFSVLMGMTVITIVGLWDDVFGLDPRLKIAGQLVASAALALEDVGTKVAAGIMQPIGQLFDNPDLTWLIELPFPLPLFGTELNIDLIYWAGTIIIAIFVIGACNASNLIDGLDGLLSGVTAIAVGGMLVVALLMAQGLDGPLDNARIVMCLAVIGACMGFLCHNFNPATIFLGDCGSMLLGYMAIVIVLTLGDTGKTHYVVGGLVIYAIPIIDTLLAMVRRKLAGLPMSAPDAHHLHHMLKRALGVKGAVLTLYGIGLAFAIVGVWMTFGRVRLVMTVALVLIAFISVTAVKIARKQVLERQAIEKTARRARAPIPGAASLPAEASSGGGSSAKSGAEAAPGA